MRMCACAYTSACGALRYSIRTAAQVCSIGMCTCARYHCLLIHRSVPVCSIGMCTCARYHCLLIHRSVPVCSIGMCTCARHHCLLIHRSVPVCSIGMSAFWCKKTLCVVTMCELLMRMCACAYTSACGALRYSIRTAAQVCSIGMSAYD